MFPKISIPFQKLPLLVPSTNLWVWEANMQLKFLVSQTTTYLSLYFQTNSILWKNLDPKVRNNCSIHHITAKDTTIIIITTSTNISHWQRIIIQTTPQTQSYPSHHPDEWPLEPLTVIRDILREPSPQQYPSRFRFETTNEAAEHNWSIMSEDDNLGKCIMHDGKSPLSYGSDFDQRHH